MVEDQVRSWEPQTTYGETILCGPTSDPPQWMLTEYGRQWPASGPPAIFPVVLVLQMAAFSRYVPGVLNNGRERAEFHFGLAINHQEVAQYIAQGLCDFLAKSKSPAEWHNREFSTDKGGWYWYVP